MIDKIFGELAKAGLSDIAESLFDVVVDTGKDMAIGKINEVSGLSLSLDKELSDSDISYLKDNKQKVLDSLEATIEENRHIEKMGELDIEAFEISVDSTKDARATSVLQLEKGKSFLERNWTHLFAVLGSTGLLTLIYLIITMPDIDENKQYIYTALGTFLALLTQVFNYYFGHTRSSGHKTDIINDLSKK